MMNGFIGIKSLLVRKVTLQFGPLHNGEDYARGGPASNGYAISFNVKAALSV
jgi:hypothetical protein